MCIPCKLQDYNALDVYVIPDVQGTLRVLKKAINIVIPRTIKL